jgi:hypothetical protein
MAGIIKSHLQLGDSATATQNFMVTAQAADGTMKIARGNNGATTQDIITVATDGNVQLTKTASQSMVRVNTANGYGSTNTKIPRFTNVVANQGSDITYADSATLGASFTINTNGVYAISYSDAFGGTVGFGISLNTTTTTTNFNAIAVSERLSIATCSSSGASVTAQSTVYLAAGAVVRPHVDGTASTGSGNLFTITRVA